MLVNVFVILLINTPGYHDMTRIVIYISGEKKINVVSCISKIDTELGYNKIGEIYKKKKVVEF